MHDSRRKFYVTLIMRIYILALRGLSWYLSGIPEKSEEMNRMGFAPVRNGLNKEHPENDLFGQLLSRNISGFTIVAG